MCESAFDTSCGTDARSDRERRKSRGKSTKDKKESNRLAKLIRSKSVSLVANARDSDAHSYASGSVHEALGFKRYVESNQAKPQDESWSV